MNQPGEIIQKLRKKHAMTQKELAERLGFSESYISYIEKGERNMSINDLQKIAKLFSVNMDYLLTKPKVTHFRAIPKKNDTTDYDKIMNDFRKYADEQI